MDKKEVSAFFGSLADSWDNDMIKTQREINKNIRCCRSDRG